MGDSVRQWLYKHQKENHHQHKKATSYPQCNAQQQIKTYLGNTYENKTENNSKMRQVFMWLKGIDASVQIDDTFSFTVIFLKCFFTHSLRLQTPNMLLVAMIRSKDRYKLKLESKSDSVRIFFLSYSIVSFKYEIHCTPATCY